MAAVGRAQEAKKLRKLPGKPKGDVMTFNGIEYVED